MGRDFLLCSKLNLLTAVTMVLFPLVYKTEQKQEVVNGLNLPQEHPSSL